MITPRQRAIAYLRPQQGAPWRWVEDGAVIIWEDGTTIAFRAEIVQILQHLAPSGLPPFGALVLLLAALREKFPTPEILTGSDVAGPWTTPPSLTTPVELKAPSAKSLEEEVQTAQHWRGKTLFNVVLEHVRMVAELPEALRTGLAARSSLAAAILEPRCAKTLEDQQWILQGITEPMTDEELMAQPGKDCRDGPFLWARELEYVAEGLKAHTPASLALRVQTGLDALPEAADVDLSDLSLAEQARRLINDLRADQHCGAAARAARDLLAVLRLPRRLQQEEEMPMGGIADISNRGPLDRLLLSELAHDDLTLAVRVALNEALYLRREPLSRDPPGALALLLDSGVRLWGVPRILATSVALALVASGRQINQLLAWRARGSRLEPVDLLSRIGLTDHLGRLATEAHVGAALPAFVKALPADVAAHAVIITEREALDDLEFRRAVNAYAERLAFVATVTREGRFELHSLPLSRRSPLSQGELDLEKIFNPAIGVPPIDVQVEPDLPAIFGVRPFPFLLPVSGQVDRWHIDSENRVYGVLNDRRLIELVMPSRGARILAVNMPAGKTEWMDIVDGVIHLVKRTTTHQPSRLLSFPLPYGPLQVLEMKSVGPLNFHRCGDVLLTMGRNHVSAISLVTGREISRTINPHWPVGGRIMRGHKNWYVVGWDGGNIRVEQVKFPGTLSGEKVRMVFDRKGLEGPWYLTQQGDVCSLADTTRIHIPLPVTLNEFDDVVVFSDGHQISISKSSQWRFFMDLQRREGFELNRFGMRPPRRNFDEKDWLRLRETQNWPRLPNKTLYRVVEAIGVFEKGLVLKGRRDTWRLIFLDTDVIRITALKSPTFVRPCIEFSREPRKPNRGGFLYSAEWPSGARAWLDSWGMLHLRSADPTAPEVSLVLAAEEVAAWTSDGHVCGPAFFFDRDIHSDPQAVMHCLHQFIRSVA